MKKDKETEEWPFPPTLFIGSPYAGCCRFPLEVQLSPPDMEEKKETEGITRMYPAKKE